MYVESNFFELSSTPKNQQSEFHDAKLLKITTYSQLWRISRCGKFFLVKTTKDNNEAQRNILQREYELSIGCDHPHIVHSYIYDSIDGIGEGIIMEYIEGDTLAEYLAQKPSKHERQRLFGELLSAVAYLHKRGIIHNDLKLENIMVTRADATLKLIDFGLADTSAHYALKSLGCTPRYASPELRERSREVDARSDIYSLGVIMQEMLGESRFSRHCMQAKPEKRYANVEALQKAWHNRHNAWYFVVGLAALALIVTPLGLYLTEKKASNDLATTIDIKALQMEREIDRLYNAVADTISRSHYSEFAIMHITSMYEQSERVKEAIVESESNKEVKSALRERYGEIVRVKFGDLTNKASSLPTIYSKDISHKEREYYNTLIEQRKPYSPYPSGK